MKTGETVRDSLTYSMNLTLANAGADPVFELTYSAKDAYALPDLSPATWTDTVYKMATDTELFDEFYRHQRSFWAEPAELAWCQTECRTNQLCFAVSGDRTDDEPCQRIRALIPDNGNVTSYEHDF
ncbi:hypothetical protein HAZT_HAZT002090 [Hyalella azteca]|uniref:Sphingomyelin phosphodiesterase C-terminal domain-containing protein n=1 Tax=Hyalella azteca TaxID=294128 RepID=A0A6A0HCN9_HYAAZ|nr:hypothetical protein HAZT_HAZT002090 [Hyalella azteca]